MCFSASASFIASGGLTVVGAASVHAAEKTGNKWNRLIVAIPFLFAIQQAFEGVQWLSDRGSCTSTVVGYGFLFFAFLFWPIYVPLSVYILDRKRRHLHQLFFGLGVALALFLLSILLTKPLAVAFVGKSVDYQIDIPWYWFLAAGYIIAVVGAPITSTNRFYRWLGILTFIAAALAETFFYSTFISVWCFFAALVSVSVFIYLRSLRKHG